MKALATRAQETPRQAAAMPAFRIGAVDDAAEREADAIADRVLGTSVLRRKCEQCEEEDKRLSRRADGGAIAASARSNVGAALAESGMPLRPADAAFFASRLGTDLAGLRVHDGPSADRAARSVGARAFTLGEHLVFARGAYQPDDRDGRSLLAHELAHVAQDRNQGTIRRQPEPEAEARPRTRTFLHRGVRVFVRADCETTPGFSFEIMRTAVSDAIDKVFATTCIRPGIRRAMQNNLRRGGLDFHCADSDDLDNVGACAEATGFSRPANIFTIGTEALDPGTCGPLASTILHEIIHIVRGEFGEDLPRSCEASCYGQPGDPTRCRGAAAP
jgi:hypothetical protein